MSDHKKNPGKPPLPCTPDNRLEELLRNNNVRIDIGKHQSRGAEANFTRTKASSLQRVALDYGAVAAEWLGGREEGQHHLCSFNVLQEA
jgi:hypothetical protein